MNFKFNKHKKYKYNKIKLEFLIYRANIIYYFVYKEK